MELGKKSFALISCSPPRKPCPDRDGASDPDADKKGLDSDMAMVGRGNCEKKDGEISDHPIWDVVVPRILYLYLPSTCWVLIITERRK